MSRAGFWCVLPPSYQLLPCSVRPVVAERALPCVGATNTDRSSLRAHPWSVFHPKTTARFFLPPHLPTRCSLDLKTLKTGRDSASSTAPHDIALPTALFKGSNVAWHVSQPACSSRRHGRATNTSIPPAFLNVRTPSSSTGLYTLSWRAYSQSSASLRCSGYSHLDSDNQVLAVFSNVIFCLCLTRCTAINQTCYFA